MPQPFSLFFFFFLVRIKSNFCMGNVVKWKTIGKFILKSDFLILLILAREGVFLLISCWGGGGSHHQSKRYCTPPFNLSRKTSLIGLTLVSCTKMDFVFVFFSLGLGLVWMMWNNTRPSLPVLNPQLPPLTLTNKQKTLRPQQTRS